MEFGFRFDSEDDGPVMLGLGEGGGVYVEVDIFYSNLSR
jgi:hypothetical protein